MEEKLFFSVLIPVYNVESYIRQCIDSVLIQEESSYEIILCDDGSTDGSGKICDEYVAVYPNKIRVIHKSNEGLLLTRRRLIKEAKGEWFIHLDSDDYMLPDALKTIRFAATKYRADLVIFSYLLGGKNNNDSYEIPVYKIKDGSVFTLENKKELIMHFMMGGLNNIWQKAARREIVDIDADYESLSKVSLMEDYLQSFPLLEHCKRAVFVDRQLVYYRYNSESITKKNDYSALKKNLQSKRMVYKEEKSYREKWGLSPEEVARVFAKHIRSVCLFVGKMSATVKTKEEKRNFREFIKKYSCDKELFEEFKNSDKRVLGKMSSICMSLIKLKMSGAIRLLYKLSEKINNETKD